MRVWKCSSAHVQRFFLLTRFFSFFAMLCWETLKLLHCLLSQSSEPLPILMSRRLTCSQWTSLTEFHQVFSFSACVLLPCWRQNKRFLSFDIWKVISVLSLIKYGVSVFCTVTFLCFYLHLCQPFLEIGLYLLFTGVRCSNDAVITELGNYISG